MQPQLPEPKTVPRPRPLEQPARDHEPTAPPSSPTSASACSTSSLCNDTEPSSVSDGSEIAQDAWEPSSQSLRSCSQLSTAASPSLRAGPGFQASTSGSAKAACRAGTSSRLNGRSQTSPRRTRVCCRGTATHATLRQTPPGRRTVPGIHQTPTVTSSTNPYGRFLLDMNTHLGPGSHWHRTCWWRMKPDPRWFTRVIALSSGARSPASVRGLAMSSSGSAGVGVPWSARRPRRCLWPPARHCKAYRSSTAQLGGRTRHQRRSGVLDCGAWAKGSVPALRSSRIGVAIQRSTPSTI